MDHLEQTLQQQHHQQQHAVGVVAGSGQMTSYSPPSYQTAPMVASGTPAATCISFVKSCNMSMIWVLGCFLLKAKQQHAYILAIWTNCFLLKPTCICIFCELGYVVGLIYIT